MDISNVAKHRVMFVHVTFFVVKYFFLTRLPARITVCFMATQCSQVARYLSLPVFIAVRFIASKV